MMWPWTKQIESLRYALRYEQAELTKLRVMVDKLQEEVRSAHLKDLRSTIHAITDHLKVSVEDVPAVPAQPGRKVVVPWEREG